MKTRIIKTDIFCDETMLQLETQSRMIAVYLYCNKHIDITPIYKLPIGYIQLETGYDVSSIKLSLDKLQEVGIIQHMNYFWIKLCREDFGVLLYSGPNNENAIKKYMYSVPEDVKLYFKYESTDTTPHTTQGVARNKKSEIRNHNTSLQTSNTEYEVPSAEPEVSNSKSGVPSAQPEASSSQPELDTRTTKSRTKSSKQEVTPLLEMFDIFWADYPVKKGKPRSKTAWLKLKPSKKLLTTILLDLEKRIQNDRQWLDGYIQHPSTYLNQRVWEDEIIPPRRKNNFSKEELVDKNHFEKIKSIKID